MQLYSIRPLNRGDSWLPLRRFLLAVMRPNSSGRFRDPKSQIIRRRRMLLHFKQKFLLQSVRYALFVWIAKCRDRAARTYNKHTGSWKQFQVLFCGNIWTGQGVGNGPHSLHATMEIKFDKAIISTYLISS